MTRSTKAIAITALTLCLPLTQGCAAQEAVEETGGTESALTGATFTAKGSAYFPDASAMEGGFVDRKGARLRTLQQFLAGQADYVSVAMDATAFKYGQRLRIKELDAKHGKDIVFRVVDTGGAFTGKGKSRIDVCVSTRTQSMDATINGRLTITPVGDDAPIETPAPTVATKDEPEETDDASKAGGQACSSDGACNPGNDGSGLVCKASRCVPGCRTNAQCPGATRCVSGQCR